MDVTAHLYFRKKDLAPKDLRAILFEMSSLQIRQEINREVALLPAEKERQVLEFVRFLRTQEPLVGTSGATLRHLRGSISSEQLAEVVGAIEEEW